jgi:hypothetical protein
MVLQAGGARTDNVDAIHRSVLATVGSAPTLLAREDDLLNKQGLDWFGARQITVPPYGPDSLAVEQQELARVRY